MTSFVEETDPDVRTKILEIVPEETRRALEAQWAAREDRIKERRGKKQETLSSEGRPYTQEDLDAYKKAKTQLGLGDWMRSSEIASFFFKHGFALPDQGDSEVLSDALDYQDVKLKIVQQEGYDAQTRSLPPAATYISRARAGAPAPLVSHSRPVTAARSLLISLSVSLFFRLRCAGTEFRTRFRTRVQFRSPAVRNSAPLFRTQRKFRTHSAPASHSGWGYSRAGQGSGSLRSVVRAACETPAIPLLSLPYI